MATTVTAQLPATVNLAAWHGDTYTQQFQVLAGDQPIDLTDLDIQSSVQGTDGTVTQLVVSVIGDPINGTFQIATPGLVADLYQYDIQATDPDGTRNTWIAGHLRIHQDVT